MKRLWLILAAVLFACGPVAAQETKSAAEIVDPTATEWTLEKLDNPPAREIKFEQLETEFPLRLSRPDPKLLEQKYVAIVRLESPTDADRFTDFRTISSWDHQTFRPLQGLGGRRLISGDLYRDEAIKPGFERFVAQIPKDRLPPLKDLALFLSSDIDQGYLRFAPWTPPPPGKKNVTEIQLLATSPEAAQERVKAFLQLLDLGGFRPIQMGAFKHRETLVEQWRADRKVYDEQVAKLAELDQKLTNYSDFTADMLTGLRLQQLQLDVNLAGAKARLATCDALLKDGLAEANRLKVEEIRIATAIEVAGIEASRVKATELIKVVKEKNELQSQQLLATNSRRRLQSTLSSLAGSIQTMDRVLTENAPMPLLEGKVLIQPIKWTP